MSNTISPAANGRANVRTPRTRRLSRVECAILGLTAVALAAAAISSVPPTTNADLPTTSIRVHNGDTLWSIASAHPVAGLDTARTADLIAEINGFDGAALSAGSAILVPGDTSSDAVAMR